VLQHFEAEPIPNETVEVVRESQSIEVTERVKFPPKRISSLNLLARNTAIILALWTAHAVWTYYCVLRAKQLGPLLKLVICLCILPVLLVLLLIFGIRRVNNQRTIFGVPP